VTAVATPSRLARRLGLRDAVVIGLSSMIGAGVFAALAPAARAAGSTLLLGLAVAGAIAYCNAVSSARLAALYPESGGTYVYGRRRLGPFWGFLAGWGFVVGKLASCAAMALTFAHYAAPGAARYLAVAAVVALTAANVLGVAKVAALSRAIVALVLASLAVFVAVALASGRAQGAHLAGFGHAGVYDTLRSAGFLFFAFAGYARIATLGEEVVEPERTIPRAIPLALGVTLVVYVAVAVSALLASGPAVVASSDAPLKAVLEAVGRAGVAPVVQVGAAVASLGVLLSLLAGVSRTVFAMAANADLPRPLAAVEPRRRTPAVAVVASGLVVAVVCGASDIRSAIGFSSFCVLVYYALANASALTLRAGARASVTALAGVVGCLAVAVTLPAESVVAGTAVLSLGALAYGVRRRRARAA
jgi:basic amino acid/polyamine antiporter, APA family